MRADDVAVPSSTTRLANATLIRESMQEVMAT